MSPEDHAGRLELGEESEERGLLAFGIGISPRGQGLNGPHVSICVFLTMYHYRRLFLRAIDDQDADSRPIITCFFLPTSVHGGPHKQVISITREHTEGLKEMDALSEFAPLHVGSTPSLL